MPLFKKQKESELNACPAMKWGQCWAKTTPEGKPGIRVSTHGIIAGHVAKELCSLQRGSEACATDFFPFTVAAHDVGKVSPGFQKKYFNAALSEINPGLASASSEAQGWTTNHAEVGEAAFAAWLAARNVPGGKTWAEAIGIHHGMRNDPKQEGCAIYGGGEWAAERNELLDHLHKYFNPPLPKHSLTTATFKILAGLTCVADWIASNEEFFPGNNLPGEKELRPKVADALADSGWRNLRYRANLDFQKVFGFPPNETQGRFIECVDGPGIYVLEAPMGSGKTEAALFAAYKLLVSGKNTGLYFGLPTRLTSDRIHIRVESFMNRILEDPGFVKLVHGHAWLNLESRAAEFRAGMSWFHPRKRALLAPLGVGTIDQALMSVLKVKHHFVRTFGLAGKVVILDEVHSYDAYTGALLDCLVEELARIGCTVIILSATLTQERRAAFVAGAPETRAYPLITSGVKTVEPKPPENRNVPLTFFEKPNDELIERAVAEAERGLCVLWIANTVAQSQDVFARINGARRQGTFCAGLLHSRFPAFRRTELEDEWMELLGKGGTRPPGCVLVATQVVEQSVDIDADLLITELAPTDMLLQRMGRLCRHSRGGRPKGSGRAWIYGPTRTEFDNAETFKEALGPSGYVYAPYVLWKTLQVWRDCPEIILPSQIRELLEATYADEHSTADWVQELKTELDTRKAKLQGAALGLTRIYCGKDDEDSARTRYSSRPTIQTLILDKCDNRVNQADIVLCDGTQLTLSAGEKDFKKAVAIHKNMVSLPVRRPLDATVPTWLTALVFGPVAVLKKDGDKLFDLAGTEMPWGYHREKGVYGLEPCGGCDSAREPEDDDESYY